MYRHSSQIECNCYTSESDTINDNQYQMKVEEQDHSHVMEGTFLEAAEQDYSHVMEGAFLEAAEPDYSVVMESALFEERKKTKQKHSEQCGSGKPPKLKGNTPPSAKNIHLQHMLGHAPHHLSEPYGLTPSPSRPFFLHPETIQQGPRSSATHISTQQQFHKSSVPLSELDLSFAHTPPLSQALQSLTLSGTSRYHESRTTKKSNPTTSDLQRSGTHTNYSTQQQFQYTKFIASPLSEQRGLTPSHLLSSSRPYSFHKSSAPLSGSHLSRGLTPPSQTLQGLTLSGTSRSHESRTAKKSNFTTSDLQRTHKSTSDQQRKHKRTSDLQRQSKRISPHQVPGTHPGQQRKHKSTSDQQRKHESTSEQHERTSDQQRKQKHERTSYHAELRQTATMEAPYMVEALVNSIRNSYSKGQLDTTEAKEQLVSSTKALLTTAAQVYATSSSPEILKRISSAIDKCSIARLLPPHLQSLTSVLSTSNLKNLLEIIKQLRGREISSVVACKQILDLVGFSVCHYYCCSIGGIIGGVVGGAAGGPAGALVGTAIGTWAGDKVGKSLWEYIKEAIGYIVQYIMTLLKL